VAQADPHMDNPHADEGQFDPDIDHNLWWRDTGVHPNDIIPLTIDPETGTQLWNDTVITVSRAEPGDKYGDIQVDNARHFEIYKKSNG
jgi:thiosulfate reductase / polysulfide reductase chain A